MQRILTSLLQTAACLVLVLGLNPSVRADDKKADASGTWTWTTPGRNGGEPRKMALTLKADGEKLTGKLTAPNRQGETTDTEISDGKVKGEDVSFTVTREVGGNKMVQKFSGKLSADAIKGKMEFDRNGEATSRDWEAKRDGEKK